jgi:hypothetical protein
MTFQVRDDKCNCKYGGVYCNFTQNNDFNGCCLVSPCDGSGGCPRDEDHSPSLCKFSGCFTMSDQI